MIIKTFLTQRELIGSLGFPLALTPVHSLFFFRDGCKMLNGRSSAPDWRFNIWQFWVKDWRVANIKKKTAGHQQTILSAVSPKRYQAVQGSFSHLFFLVFAMKIELFIKEKELLWIGPRSNTLIESVGVSAKCIFK